MKFRLFKRKRYDPIEAVHKLTDEPGLIYVWVVRETENGLTPIEISNFINSAYISEYGHEPRALHLVLREIGDIERMTAEEYKQRIKPYIGA